MIFKFHIFLLLVFINVQNILASDILEDKIREKKIVLTDDEKIVLDNGDLGPVRYTVGGILGVYPGFGIGHGVQGRWSSRGRIFAGGELVSGFLIIFGVLSTHCSSSGNTLTCSNDATKIGVLGFVGFKIWEIIDVWYGGYRQMKDYSSLQDKVLNQSEKTKNSFFLLPSIGPRTAGLQLGMTF